MRYDLLIYDDVFCRKSVTVMDISRRSFGIVSGRNVCLLYVLTRDIQTTKEKTMSTTVSVLTAISLITKLLLLCLYM